jgi:cyclophilin family peptidyl-prolyl cis-trans isomerase
MDAGMRVTAVALLGLAVSFQRPFAAEPPVGEAAAQAEFDGASAEMRRLVAELSVLQGQYHLPDADKAGIEAKYRELAPRAAAAGSRLENAAIALAIADPEATEAREISASAVGGAFKADAPEVALEKATRLDAAGVAGIETLLLASQAAMALSRPDDVAAWLAKAEAKGAPPKQLQEARAAVARERPKVESEMAKRKAEAAADDLPRVRLSTSVGDVVVELFENEAPNTVANFISLVEKGYYDGTPFHRVIGGFMAQGGDPTGTGHGGPGYTIACEVDAPEARKHFRGTLSMAHAGRDSGGSQFFLTFRPTDHLDGKHTVFGRVIEGFDVLSKLMRTTDDQGRPVLGVQPDRIVKAEMLRKRDHPYVPQTKPDARPRER